MKKVIQLREVLRFMESGNAFAITVIKADRQRNKGGEIVNYENCRLYRPDEINRETKNKLTDSGAAAAAVPPSRNPEHYLKATRNLRLQNGEIRKIHIRLIVKFNGMHVIY